MYKKRKRFAVDVDAITRDITRKVYASIMGQLASQGIEISMPQEASTEAAGKSSCSSKEVDQKVVDAVIEPDTIDLLEGPTHCSLVIRPGRYLIEVASGQVLPNVRILHQVLIRDSYAMVTVDIVHSNTTDHVLELP